MNNNRGITLIELIVVIAVSGILVSALVNFMKVFTVYQISSQQIADLQILGKVSLEQMKREVRQAFQVGNLPAYQNYTLGVTSMSVIVPNLSTPYNQLTADIIWYSTGTYHGQPNRLLQRVDQTPSGGALSPWIPILVNMDNYRRNPLTASVTAAGMENLFDRSEFQYDNVVVYWNQARDTLAISLVLSAKRGNVVTRLPLRAVVNLRS